MCTHTHQHVCFLYIIAIQDDLYLLNIPDLKLPGIFLRIQIDYKYALSQVIMLINMTLIITSLIVCEWEISVYSKTLSVSSSFLSFEE